MSSNQVIEGLRVEWEAIANWRAGLIARLTVDRFLGGEVSPELIALARKRGNRLPPPCEWTGQVGKVDLGPNSDLGRYLLSTSTIECSPPYPGAIEALEAFERELVVYTYRWPVQSEAKVIAINRAKQLWLREHLNDRRLSQGLRAYESPVAHPEAQIDRRNRPRVEADLGKRVPGRVILTEWNRGLRDKYLKWEEIASL